ncbi:hypothetical protein CIL03_14845 [Virgibacillus indicus]|uniref:Bacterial spore germination immunoglobulin-like domain-containing protein n=2 Tax=Virgibacillus indicus TaxID=2024554 RepID=A0A265N820_9BACI|nr:hypothetical protein CIL03_14845 [Virgibacillus indicus]
MDSLEKINETRVNGMKYLIMIVTALMLVACSESAEDEMINNDTEESDSVSFRNVDVKTDDNQVHLTGQVSAAEGEFYYTAEQGEEKLIEENHVEVEEGTHGWSEFSLEITLPDGTAEKEEAPVVTLYGKNKTGKVINPNYVPIDLNMKKEAS